MAPPIPRLITSMTIVLLCATPSAHGQSERPPTRSLVLAGSGMAIPVYFTGVAVHESSHALAAKLLGADLIEFSVLPGRYGPRKHFYFGYTQVRGLRSDSQRTLFWLAPKITDSLILGAFGLVVALDGLPDNRYGQLALTVVAAGFWVDFSKDIIAFSDGNDMIKIYNTHGYESELAKLPWRLLHAGLSAAAAYGVYRGFDSVFADDNGAAQPVLLPMWQGTF